MNLEMHIVVVLPGSSGWQNSFDGADDASEYFIEELNSFLEGGARATLVDYLTEE